MGDWTIKTVQGSITVSGKGFERVCLWHRSNKYQVPQNTVGPTLEFELLAAELSAVDNPYLLPVSA